MDSQVWIFGRSPNRDYLGKISISWKQSGKNTKISKNRQPITAEIPARIKDKYEIRRSFSGRISDKTQKLLKEFPKEYQENPRENPKYIEKTTLTSSCKTESRKKISG